MNVIIAFMCYNASMSVTYKDVEREPERYQLLSNGAIYDHKVKHIMGNPGGGTTAITKATTSAMRKTWEEQKLKAAFAAQEGARVALEKDTELEAWAAIVGGQASLAVATGQGQTSTKAAEFVGKAAGFLSDRRSQQQDTGQTNVQIAMGADAIAQLVGVLDVNNSNELIIDE